MSEYTDDDEGFADGDPAIDFDKLEEVAAVLDTAEPLDALTAIYGDKLVVPA